MAGNYAERLLALRKSTKHERRQAERIADEIGVTLGTGLMVNGHHGMPHRKTGCGSYDLAISLVNEWVYCVECDAADLTTKKMMEAVK